MKKIVFAFVVSFSMFFTMLSADVSAALPKEMAAEPEIIYEDEDIIVECQTIVYESDAMIQPFATKKTISAAKVAKIKNGLGTLLATYTLSGTFTFDGTSSTCTAASYSSSIAESYCSFSSRSASKSGNKAYGSYTLYNSSSGKSYSGSLTITCSKSGTVS